MVDELSRQNVLSVKLKCQDLWKKQEAKGLLSNLGNKTPSSKIPLFCFKAHKNKWSCEQIFIVGDKFMPKMHLKQPGFTYSACGTFTRNKERTEKFMQTRNTDFI